AAASSSDQPAARAIGAAYFIDSPNMVRSTLADAAVLARTSATRLISEASMPKPDMMLEAMSAALARSTDPAAARFNTSGSPARISLVSHPAIPRNSIAEAASVAE